MKFSMFIQPPSPTPRSRTGVPAGVAIRGPSTLSTPSLTSDAQQALEILPEDRVLLVLREAFHAENPGDRPVERHVVGPVGAEDHAVDADGIDQEAQRLLRVDDAVVMELAEVCARRSRDVRARLGADLPCMIHPSDAVARVATAVAED